MKKDSEKGKYSSPEGSRTWEYLSAIFCAFGAFCLGNVMGWNSPSLTELRKENSPIPITSGEASTLTSCLAIGQIVAFPLSVFTVDRLGRKNSVLLSTVPMIVSWGLIMVAKNVEVLMLARTIAGVSMGIIISATPIYMAEILCKHTRGSFGAIGGVMCFTAVLFMFAVAPYLGMRMTAGFCMAFALTFLIFFWFVPESPYFLVMIGKVDEAESALEKLRGKTDVADELELIKATIREKGKSLVKSKKDEESELSTKKQSAFVQLFTIRGNLKSFFIGIVLTTLQHFCGFIVILYYCHMILEDLGSTLDVYIASTIFCVLQIFTAGSTALVVDRYGRRPLLFTSGMITTLLLFVIATYFYLMEHTDVEVKQYSMIPLCSIFLLVVVLNFGVVSLPGTIMSEINAPDVKMLAICICGLCGSMMTILISKFYLLMAKPWGFGHSIPFFGFTVITLSCISILMWLLPETKGKTLLEIQRELNA